jgi:hypothetical protein
MTGTIKELKEVIKNIEEKRKELIGREGLSIYEKGYLSGLEEGLKSLQGLQPDYYGIKGEMWNPDERRYVPFVTECFTEENQDLTFKELIKTVVKKRNIYLNLKKIGLLELQGD